MLYTNVDYGASNACYGKNWICTKRQTLYNRLSVRACGEGRKQYMITDSFDYKSPAIINPVKKENRIKVDVWRR